MLHWTYNAVPLLLGTLVYRLTASAFAFYNQVPLWPSLPDYTRPFSTMPPPLHRLTATEVLGLLKDDKISVVTYVRDVLDHIDKRESIVKAWAYLDPEFVLSQARALDQIQKNKRGPLHGLAVGIKDVMNTKDMPTQMGSPIYKGHQSGFDSPAVGILRAAGALIFEFCVTNSGPNTTNPHDPNHTPGGSSCGSAAAVADFHVPLALGAQAGGSIIRPASFTGVFALKPTYNAISPEGTKVFSFNFDTLGFLTRSVDDLQLLADVFALNDDEPVQNIPLEEASIALIRTPMWGRAGPGTIAAMEKAEIILRDSGVKVVEVSFPAPLNDGDGLKRLQKIIISADAQLAFLREYRVDEADLDPEIQELVENSANFTHRETLQALDTLASMRSIIDDLAANYSAILTPSVVDEAPFGLGNIGSPTFNTL